MGFDGLVSLISNIFDRRTKMQMFMLERLVKLDERQDEMMEKIINIENDVEKFACIAYLGFRKDDIQAE